MPTREYLGDGVYISKNDIHIILETRGDLYPQIIYLDDIVTHNLLCWFERNLNISITSKVKSESEPS